MRLVFAMPGNEKLADDIARAGAFERGQLEVRRFPDGESHVRVLADVRGKAVDVVCTLARPDAQIMPLVLVAGALREWGASSVGLIAPYLAYMRQDAHFASGDALSAAHFARLISSQFDALTTVDPHLHRISALSDIYSIPARTVHAAKLLGSWIAANVDNPVLIGPDSESAQWVAAAASAAQCQHVLLSKVRSGDRRIQLHWPDLGVAVGRTPVLVDDVASSGSTLITAAKGLIARGLGKPVCVIVHALIDDGAYADLAAYAGDIVSTDTVAHRSNAISVAPILI